MAVSRKGKKKMVNKRTTVEREPEPEVEDDGEGEGDDDDDGEGEGDDGEGDGDGEEVDNGDAERPELTAKEKGALFKAYQETVDTLEEVREAMEVAKGEVGEAVEQIFNKMGPGPFRWKGREICIRSRKGKYYMRVLAEGAEEIEA